MKLEIILNLLQQAKIVDDCSNNLDASSINIDFLSYNSNNIQKNTLFICKGKLFKSEYLKKAIDSGVVAYLSEEKYDDIDENIFYIQVNDIREAMTIVANHFYQKSWKDIKTVGITGTKGKTTTTYYLKNIIDKYLKKRCAIISTIETYSGITNEESHLTTPESPDLHRLFYETKISNIPILVMEVTSQAYKMKRIKDVTFDIGVFLNICEDHISDAEHPNFQDYLNCKLEFMKNVKLAIVNKDTDFFGEVKKAAQNAEKIITYGTTNEADYYVTNIVKNGKSLMFDVNHDDVVKTYKTNMMGKFNVENALAAIVVAKSLGIDEESISYGIENTEVQGRMNIFEKDGVTVIVDYAHNFLSFSKLYESINLYYPNRQIISVGGGPGGKAYSRRREFGTLANKYSSHIYLTAEDPQFESVKDICLDIAKYIDRDKYEIVEDRKEAVLKSLKEAKKGDIVVLLAKGEEDYQKVKGVFTFYESDLGLVKAWLDESNKSY